MIATTLSGRQDLEAQIAMIDDALAEPGNPNAAKLVEIRAALVAKLPTAPNRETVGGDLDNRRAAGSPAANQYGTFQVHTGSDAQIRFATRLASERDVTRLGFPFDAAKIPTLNKRALSDLIDALLRCPEKAGTAARTTGARMATEKQQALIAKLLDEKDLDAMVFNPTPGVSLECRTDWNLAVSGFTTQQASRAIDALFSYPRKSQPSSSTSSDTLEAGIYLHDGEVFKVQKAVHGSGNMYAKKLVVEVPGEKGRFEYAAGMIRKLQASEKMTLEQAKEFGAIYGVCCNCGATLTNEDSIEAGIGPVCAKRFA